MSFEKQALSPKLIAAAISKASPKKLHSLPILERLFKKDVGNIGEYSSGISSSVLNNALGSLRNRGLNNPAFNRILSNIDSEGGASAKRYLLDRLRREASIYGNIGSSNLSAALNNTANLAETGARGAFRAPFNGITINRSSGLSGGGYNTRLIGRPYSDSRRAVLTVPKSISTGVPRPPMPASPPVPPRTMMPPMPPKPPMPPMPPRPQMSTSPTLPPKPPMPPMPPKPPMPPRSQMPTQVAQGGPRFVIPNTSLIPPRPMLPPRPSMPSPWLAAAAAAAPIAGGAAYMANN